MSENTYGYVLVSTQEQNEARQLAARREFGVAEENIIVEKQSGKDFHRPRYQRLVAALKAGDVLERKFGEKLIRVEVLSTADIVGKADAEAMYRQL